MNNKKRPGKVFIGALLIVLSVILPAFVIYNGLIIAKAPAPASSEYVKPDTVPPVFSKMPPEEDTASNTPKDSPVSAETEQTDKISVYVSSMTLREKLCQMMIVTPDSLTGVSGEALAESVTPAALERYPVGGLIHFSANIESEEQITQFNAKVQLLSKTPMFIASDEEGGRVGRLKTQLGAHSVGAMLSYEKYGAEKAEENAKTLSNALKKHGYNTDFAPVADVWSNPENTVIGDRAYSTDFDAAAKLVAAAVRGFIDSGIVCSLKHFPGHGDTSEDSHNSPAFINKSLDELFGGELKPFIAGIEAGADMIMLGHLIVPTEDELPATLSKRIVTDILRVKLGFEGLVITDSLAMGAISSGYSAEYTAVTAVLAGVDILLMPSDIEKTLTALTDAVISGEISQERIDESVYRIISLKAARGILSF